MSVAVETVVRVQYPGVVGPARIVSFVTQAASSLEDARQYAEAYARQTLAEEMSIEVISVELVGDD